LQRIFFLNFIWQASLRKTTENYDKSSQEAEKALSDLPESLKPL